MEPGTTEVRTYWGQDEMRARLHFSRDALRMKGDGWVVAKQVWFPRRIREWLLNPAILVVLSAVIPGFLVGEVGAIVGAAAGSLVALWYLVLSRGEGGRLVVTYHRPPEGLP